MKRNYKWWLALWVFIGLSSLDHRALSGIIISLAFIIGIVIHASHDKPEKLTKE